MTGAEAWAEKVENCFLSSASSSRSSCVSAAWRMLSGRPPSATPTAFHRAKSHSRKGWPRSLRVRGEGGSESPSFDARCGA